MVKKWFNDLGFMRKRRGMLTKREVQKRGDAAYMKWVDNDFKLTGLDVGTLIALGGRNRKM